MPPKLALRYAPEAQGVARRPFRPSLLLAVLVFLVCGMPSIEGYTQALSSQANKLIPVTFLGVWACVLFYERRWPRMHVVSYCAAGLLVLILFTVAINPWNPNRFILLSRWAPFLIVTIALIDVMATKVHPKVAVWGMAAGAVVAGLGALFSFLVLHSPRATGPMEDPNDLAYVLTAAIAPLLVGVSRGRTGWALWAGRIGAVICAVGALSTMSRGGILAMATLLLWGILRRLVKMRDIIIGAVAGSVAVALAFAVASDAINLALQQKAYIAQGNVDQREMRWEAALRGLADRPWFGMSPGGAAQSYVEHSNLAEIREMTPVVHNMYIETASEVGIFGFVLFVTMIVSTLVTTVHYYKKDMNTALAAQGAMLAIVVASTFLSEQYYMPLWATIAIGGALQLRRTQKETR